MGLVERVLKRGTYFGNWNIVRLISGGACGERTDIYSLGLVLYELTNDGKLPFAMGAEPTAGEIGRRITGEPLPRPKRAEENQWKVIRRACAFDPAERYSSAGEMLEAVSRVGQTRKKTRA